MRARMGGKLSKPKKNGYQSEKKGFAEMMEICLYSVL